jgi:hypothetical protein
VQATIRFRQQLVDDRVELYDACQRHTGFVRDGLAKRLIEHGDAVVAVLETTPPADAACPYDAANCNPGNCDRHQALIPSGVEDGQLMGTS